jgi:FkbM family methyltransferase
MTMQQFVSRLSNWVPLNVRTALRGRRSSPSWFATAVHSILNRATTERYLILPCGGALKGFRMRVDWEMHRSFAYGSWEPEVVEVVRQYVKPGMTALDIGAQSGYFSLLLSKLVGPGGKVIAFEPLPANFRVLEENVHLNGLTNVTVRQQAVAKHSGQISFEFPSNEPTLIAGPLLDGDSRGVFNVQTVSLDDVFPENSLPALFIKMDVEGAETDVLIGALRLLNYSHPDMLIELHNMERQTGPHPAVVIVENLGYEIQWLSEIASTAHIFARWKGENRHERIAPRSKNDQEGTIGKVASTA